MPDLTDELRRLADEAARQARPLPMADVIRQGDRAHRRASTLWSRGSARTPGLAARARPRRRLPGWVAPVAAASGVTLAVGLAVALGGQVHLARHPGRANDGRAQTAYVFDAYQGTVTPISRVTGRLGKPVRVGPKAYWGGRPRRRFQTSRIVQDLISPDGTANYALYYNGHDLASTEALRRTSLVTGVTGRPIQLGRHAQRILVTPDGRTAYVTYLYFGAAGSTIRPVSLATGTVGKPILRVPGAKSTWITPVMTPDGRTIYVPYLRAGTVTPISTATNALGRPIPVPKALNMEFTPDGRTAFVFGGDTVTPISTATNTPGPAVTIGRYADSWALTPDGRTIYVNDLGFSVTPISIGTGKAGRPIPLHMEGGVGGMAITPDGKTLYVAGFKDNKVLPISVATNTPGKPLTVTGDDLGIVITPDGRTAYTFTGPVNNAQVLTPISTATNTPGTPIRIAPNTVVLLPGDQNSPY